MTRNKAAVDTTLSASGTVSLKDGSPDTVSSWLVHLVGTGFTGSCQPVGSAIGSAATQVNLAYKDMNDGTIKTAALTGTSLILIDASGIDVDLDVTVSAGSLRVIAHPLIG